ncbi:MAG TPA: hypothetical protein PKC29_14310 [Thermodesulfobacteriota bacterium]|nr:hypothetical protein [Thermodesulfobacteriota bacterium]
MPTGGGGREKKSPPVYTDQSPALSGNRKTVQPSKSPVSKLPFVTNSVWAEAKIGTMTMADKKVRTHAAIPIQVIYHILLKVQ